MDSMSRDPREGSGKTRHLGVTSFSSQAHIASSVKLWGEERGPGQL